MKFKDKFRYCRKTFGLTQAQVAEKLHVSRRMVIYYETGERDPSLETINAASKIFCTPIDYFMLESETDPGNKFIEESYRYELERYRNSDLTKQTMEKILAAGGNHIDVTDPFWDFLTDSIAEVIMYSERRKAGEHIGKEQHHQYCEGVSN